MTDPMVPNMAHYPVLERRIRDNPWKTAMVGERRHRTVPTQPLPPGERPNAPLPDPSDWTFELIERYHAAIAATAERFGLDTYPNQLEIITAEQMMDAYASVGMPVNYRHWSYGKEFLATERRYRRGHMGLAYEIVINSNPCISYLMEENTTAMQALVIAHAAYGHNSFFKGNYLFRMWTDASSIIDYLVYAKDYVAQCEERYGFDEVERILDSCHALANFGVDRYRRPSKKNLARERLERAQREAYAQQQINELWRTLPTRPGAPAAVVAQAPKAPAPAPVATPPTGVVGTENRYVVRRGDTLSKIATKHGMSEESLMDLNNIRNRNFVYEGQVLALAPSARAAPPVEAEVPVAVAPPVPAEPVAVAV